MGYLYAYLIMSVVVSGGTFRHWRKLEDEEMSIPIGDEEYYDFDYGYGILNYLFLPSILFCEGYKKVCGIVNSILERRS